MDGVGLIFWDQAEREYQRARSKHRKMAGTHEGLAVIWEEFEELKNEVFKKRPNYTAMFEEVVQIAAMCRAFAAEVINDNE